MFFIFYFRYFKKCHEAIVFRFAAMFEGMGHLRPNVIMIDKSAIEINVFIIVINDDM